MDDKNKKFISTKMDSDSEIQRLNKALGEADEARKHIDVGHFQYLQIYWSSLSSAYRNTKCLITDKTIITKLTDLKKSILIQINEAQTVANSMKRRITPSKKLMNDMDALHELILEEKQKLGLGVILKENKKRKGFKW